MKRCLQEIIDKSAIRRIDFEMRQAVQVNDNRKVEKLREQRSNIVSFAQRVAFRYSAAQAITPAQRGFHA